IPKPHSLFPLAWRKASKDMSRVKSGTVDPGYCFLKPTLLVNVTTPEQKKMYMLNWLSAHVAWMNQVDIWSLQKNPSPQMWRDFLNGTDTEHLPSGTQSASTKLAAQVILGDIIQAAHDDPVHMSEESEWRGMQVQAASLSDLPLHFTCSLLWELYELNFHYELCALDQALVPQLWPNSLDKYTHQSLLWSIFPGGCGLSSWSAPLPQEPHDLGLTASEMEVALPYLNKFCQLLSAWPGVPFHLKSPIKLDGSDCI
ncbi:hypothetical protein M404DRAFT_157861, partial [Pisolithus tinctorius Marx 270]